MTIKMIVSDMDRTFLNDRGSYNRDKFITILDQLDKRNIRFVVASNNKMDRLNLIFKGLIDRMPFVGENGSHIVEMGKTLKRHQLDKKDVALFLDYFKDKLDTYAVIVSGKYNSYMHKHAIPPKAFAIEPEQFSQFFSKIKVIDDFSTIAQEDILKISMMLPSEKYQAIMDDFNANFKGNLRAVTSGFGAVDIIETGIDKAWGLSILIDQYGVRADQLMAFGDGGNDIEMLELAKYSYAMDNAPENVKKAANFLAPHHSEDGVLQVLESFLAESDYE
ncbi:Cof-type HAD-IIB family hydrolase [Streptococcus catagoni]|uniref:Cof-type HAD-IIB family hydrolase n=1 Tax=Streptococcus catagoni TaxID=2654874 RepID=UPI00140CE0C2|nr:Cof-type HAD-IIB family hydrolase [Streptococcus catagoni]